jgi:hypothetical protein
VGDAMPEWHCARSQLPGKPARPPSARWYREWWMSLAFCATHALFVSRFPRAGGDRSCLLSMQSNCRIHRRANSCINCSQLAFSSSDRLASFWRVFSFLTRCRRNVYNPVVEQHQIDAGDVGETQREQVLSTRRSHPHARARGIARGRCNVRMALRPQSAAEKASKASVCSVVPGMVDVLGFVATGAGFRLLPDQEARRAVVGASSGG